jgi:L-ascorbate metabolism protein UlaG (beta-lactamase superfamily)
MKVNKLMTMVLISLTVVLLAIVAIKVFIKTSPQFGVKPKGAALKKIENSPNYYQGKFHNSPDRKDEFTFSTYKKLYSAMLNPLPNATPPERILPKYKNKISLEPAGNSQATVVTWLGHSTVLLQMDGCNILTDPMLSPAYGPFPSMARSQRFTNSLPLKIEDLPPIDAVLISHDHYDHLDYTTILAIDKKTNHYYVPLGIASHLLHWGISASKITELDWWDESTVKDLKLIASPAQHFSGRAPGARFSTLWASWVIKGKKHCIFFSGDTGYFEGFKKIGEKFGPFDLTLLECGQYSSMWPNFHMFPEEVLQAHLDLKGKFLMPVHWATFLLSPSHDWNEPIEKLTTKARDQNTSLVTPMIGQSFTLGTEQPQTQWWR